MDLSSAVLSACLAGVVLGLIWFLWPQQRLRHLKSQVPATSFFGGNISELVALGDLACHRVWSQRFGSLYRFRIGRNVILGCSDPDLVKSVTEHITDWPSRAISTALFKAPPDMAWAHGQYWKFLRNTIVPLFHSHNLDKFADQMNRSSDALLQALQGRADANTSFDVVALMRDTSMDIIGHAAFSQDFQGLADDAKRMSTSLRRLTRTPFALFLSSVLSLPLSWGMALLKPLKHFVVKADALVCSILAVRRSDPKSAKHDFISLMVGARDPTTQQALNNKEICDNSRLFMIGGHETIGMSLAFFLFHLSQHPQVKERVLKEIDELNNDKDVLRHDLEQYEYLEWTLKESMRVLMAAPLTSRTSGRDLLLGDHFIPKGTVLLVAQYLLHMDKTLWGDPDVFRPERFNPNSKEFRTRHKAAYQPFGGGPRMCIGYKFAMQELKTVLIRVLRKYDFQLDETRTEVPLKTVWQFSTDVPDGIHMTVHNR